MKLEEAGAASIWPEFVAELARERLADEEFCKVGPETLLIGGISLAEIIRRTVRRLLRR